MGLNEKVVRLAAVLGQLYSRGIDVILTQRTPLPGFRFMLFKAHHHSRSGTASNLEGLPKALRKTEDAMTQAGPWSEE